jgi:hypothetical protein
MRIMAAVAKSTVRRRTSQVTAIAEVIDWGKGVQGEQTGTGRHGQWRQPAFWPAHVGGTSSVR